LYHCSAFILKNAAFNNYSMIQKIGRANAEMRAHSARFRIRGTVHEPGYACVHDSARAHGARLYGRVERSVRQPVIAQPQGGCPQRDDLRMRRRVVCADHGVMAAPQYFAVQYDDSAYGDFAFASRVFGFGQRYTHELFVC
jgi:hypothetical protein